MPYSAFGRLTLAGDTINQGGVVRAPFGSIMLGSLERQRTRRRMSVHLAGQHHLGERCRAGDALWRHARRHHL
jgi:hypothetical protein